MKKLGTFFFAGMAGVLLGGLVLGFLVDLIFSNWVDSGSTTFGNWAMWTGAFFTLFAALAAGIAAKGALSTLSFMRNQHVQITEENSQRFIHEQAVWGEQREMLLFQKQREHKQEFYNVLDNLQKEHSIEFYQRSKFYSSLFPENKFNYCNYHIELNEDIADSLGDINFLFSKISSSFEKFGQLSGEKTSEHLEKHLSDISTFSSMLHINFQDNGEVGNIYWDVDQLEKKPHILNIFDSLHTTIVMQEVFFELLGFSGNTQPKSINHQRTSFYQNALLGFFKCRHYRSRFNVEKGEVSVYLDLILTVCEVINRTPVYRKDRNLWSYYNSVQRFFLNPKNKKVTLDNSKDLLDLLDRLKSAIILFHKEKDGANKPLEQFILTIEAQVSSLRNNNSNPL
ncbi:hypothetical protein [Vibrio lentus]|uniref:Phage abortive infection protein n=1 Tax=Vibrio lentus TaxID=136468 RepID=A0A855IVI5_9VIBR|nr:hypothetical protein [Vibrio lentus]PMM61874.1 hypothetical protein BCT50_17395 [Vibrio lentus]